MQSTIDRARSITALTDEEIAEQELPLPIAFLFRDFRSSRMSPRRRLERMVELFEVTLKIVAFTLMAAFRTQLPSVLPSDLRAGIARPSLGHFFRIITTLPEVTGFLQPISRATQGRRFRDLCQGFIELRNNYIGHGVLQAGAVYEQLLAQHSSQMIELLYILKDFRRCRIVWAEHADMIENGIEYTVKIFRGSNPEPTLETLLTSFELILKKHVVHLVNEKATESVDLFPWCQYLACEQRCLNEKLFLYRMWREGEIWALDHIYGHELHTRQGWEEVKKLINSGEDM
jgi:hypothetical protein